VLSGEATNTNFIVFGLTLPGLEPTIYRTRGEPANHYATDAVCCCETNWYGYTKKNKHDYCWDRLWFFVIGLIRFEMDCLLYLQLDVMLIVFRRQSLLAMSTGPRQIQLFIFHFLSIYTLYRICNSYALSNRCITNLHPRFFVKHLRLKYNILKLSFFYLYEVFNQELKNTIHYILWKTL
jgi:hypothetical protein